MKGTFVERDRKKEKKKPKGPDAGGAKKGVPGAAAPMVAGVPTAMPVSIVFNIYIYYRVRISFVISHCLFVKPYGGTF